MIYPDDFKKRIKKQFPYLKRLHEHLDKNSPKACEYLGNMLKPITNREILQHIKKNNILALKIIAENEIEKEKLYVECLEYAFGKE